MEISYQLFLDVAIYFYECPVCTLFAFKTVLLLIPFYMDAVWHWTDLLNKNRTATTGWSKKTDTQFYFWDNFGNSAQILTILSLLQAEIYGA